MSKHAVALLLIARQASNVEWALYGFGWGPVENTYWEREVRAMAAIIIAGDY